eukprot:9718073-Lingulodinium_polyedra.AAC.1
MVWCVAMAVAHHIHRWVRSNGSMLLGPSKFRTNTAKGVPSAPYASGNSGMRGATQKFGHVSPRP